MSTDNFPKVGVGVLVFKNGKVLAGKRKGSRGAGEYQWPGGHLEYLESFEECARREVREEAGIEIKNIKFQFVSTVAKYGNKHYVHIGLTSEWASGTPQLMEPEKCEGWDWYSIEDLPKPLFEFCAQHIESIKSGRPFFDLPRKNKAS